jgi:hypothetical protein
MAAPQSFEPPRRSRGFSVKSEKSNQSGTSGHKSHLSESSEEKSRRNLHTKADPLIAMNELQPSTFLPIPNGPRGRIAPLVISTDVLQWPSPWRSPIWALSARCSIKTSTAISSVRVPRHSCSHFLHNGFTDSLASIYSRSRLVKPDPASF